MFIVNQAGKCKCLYLPRSARVVVFVTFSGNLYAFQSLCRIVYMVWPQLDPVLVLEPCELKLVFLEQKLSHWKEIAGSSLLCFYSTGRNICIYTHLRWCLHIPRDACIGSDPEPICYKSLKGHLWLIENITQTTTLVALAGKDSWFTMTNFWLTMSTPGRNFKRIGLPWEIFVELECTQQNRE